MAYQSFEDLEVWQMACNLSVNFYKLLSGCKDYSLRDQMQRAGVSIAANIAEGSERNSKKDFARFLYIAKGSASELKTHIYIADKIGIISTKAKDDYIVEIVKISKMLHSLINSLLVSQLP